MALRYVYNSSGGDPVIESFLAATVTTVVGQIIYFDTSGFLSNAYTDANTVTTVLVAGVATEVVTGNSSNVSLPIICTKDARYVADTTAAAAQTDMGTNVTMDSISIVDENDPVTSSSGVIRQLKVVGLVGTATQVLCSINFGTP